MWIEPTLVDAVLDDVPYRPFHNRGRGWTWPCRTAARLSADERIETRVPPVVMRRLWEASGRGGRPVAARDLREIGGAREIVAEHLREHMDRLGASISG